MDRKANQKSRSLPQVVAMEEAITMYQDLLRNTVLLKTMQKGRSLPQMIAKIKTITTTQSLRLSTVLLRAYQREEIPCETR